MVSGFFFSLLKKFDAVYPIFNGLTMGQFPFLGPNGLTDGEILPFFKLVFDCVFSPKPIIFSRDTLLFSSEEI